MKLGYDSMQRVSLSLLRKQVHQCESVIPISLSFGADMFKKGGTLNLEVKGEIKRENQEIKFWIV